MNLDVRPVTAELWPSLGTLFGPQGACDGCGCSGFPLTPKLRGTLNRDEKTQHLKKAIEASIPPEWIALEGVNPVGWVQVTSRAWATLEHRANRFTLACRR